MTRRAGKARGGGTPTAPREVEFRAGCGRSWRLASAEPDLAYTELGFTECGACPHRVDPEGALPFCTLRPSDTLHPFAALANLNLPDD
ncbi:hypothetical protein [Deinococcus pimensis]|uniref:hypothetical protein n=1 Tax=Deinococcus pimensis TaxID=309888 RepID=UPI000484BF34|nr:hypothetical protein [Deinococcus pimensis]